MAFSQSATANEFIIMAMPEIHRVSPIDLISNQDLLLKVR